MAKWTVEYNGDIISVEARLNKCFLYLNGREIDSQIAYTSASLMGKSSSGESVRAVINAGMVRAHCNIYVNDTVIFKK